MFDDEYGAMDFFGDTEGYEDLDVKEGGFQKLEPGTHNVSVSRNEIIELKDGTKCFIVEFTDDNKATYTQFLKPILPGDREKMYGDVSVADIKKQERVNVLVSLGVPQQMIPKLQPGMLTGITGNLTIYKNKKDFLKWGKFELTDGGNVGEPLRQTTPVSRIVKLSEAATKQEDLGEYGI